MTSTVNRLHRSGAEIVTGTVNDFPAADWSIFGNANDLPIPAAKSRATPK
jgi:hypothetical protein